MRVQGRNGSVQTLLGGVEAPASLPQASLAASFRLPFARVDSAPPPGPLEPDLAEEDVNRGRSRSAQQRYAQFLPGISAVLRCCCNEIPARVSGG